MFRLDFILHEKTVPFGHTVWRYRTLYVLVGVGTPSSGQVMHAINGKKAGISFLVEVLLGLRALQIFLGLSVLQVHAVALTSEVSDV